MAEGEAEGGVIGAVFVAFLPITKLTRFFELIDKLNLLDAFEVEFVSSSVAFAGFFEG